MRTVGGFSAVIVFVATYALILPAITMEAEADCGIEAHQHNDSCYEEVLICDLPESDGHHHTSACYNDVSVLVCGLEETEGHTHASSCYKKVLTCGKGAHTHSTACYKHDFETFMETAVAADPSAGSTASTAVAAVSSYEAADLEYDDENSSSEDGTAGASASDIDLSAPEAADPSAGSAPETADPSAGSTPESNGSSAGSAPEAEGPSAGSAPEAADPSAGSASEAADLSAGSAPAASNSDLTNAADAPDAASNAASTSADSLVPANGTLSRDSYVPALDPLNFDTILTDRTGIYSYTPEDGEVIKNSSTITDWKKTAKDTELGRKDILRVYLAYTIPAGALNETNETARYRLPANLHLTDAQVKAINESVNGIARQYINFDTLEITDPDQYQKYLGAEAVEGTRTPSDDPAEYLKKHDDRHDGQEYISAVVKVEDAYDDQGDHLGQDLIFTFTPYSVQKNRHEYDSTGQPTKAGRRISGWFTLDFNIEQVDWSEPEVTTYELPEEDDETPETGEMGENPDPAGEKAENQDTEEKGENPAAEEMDENLDPSEEKAKNTDAAGDAADSADDSAVTENAESIPDNSDPASNHTKVITIERSEQTADIVFVPEGTDPQNNRIHEIHTRLTLVEETRIKTAAANTTPDEETKTPEDTDETEDAGNKEDIGDTGETEETGKKEDSSQEYKDGTLTSEGTGYKITLDYKADAQIPENAYLKVSEITRESDPEAYEACLKEAEKTIPANDRTTVDDKASRFFDIEILVDEKEMPQTDESEEKEDEQQEASTEQEHLNQEAEAETEAMETVDAENPGPVTRKIEPAAPVSVNIQLFDTEISENVDNYDAEQYKVLHFAEEGTEEIQDVRAQEIRDDQQNSALEKTAEEAAAVAPATEIRFEAEGFSIYGVVYTVDFHWNVDGKTYDFSIPGGGFVSLEHLVEVLGIAAADENSGNEAESAENDAEGADEFAGEVPGIEEDGEISTAYEEAIKLNEVDVSEAAKKFVAGVESVEFSSPKLVWVGKVDEEKTVGGLKEANELDIVYSAELTEEQIAEINAQTVKTGDWALISLQSFTSDEVLTVTMKNGEIWTIHVTDWVEGAYGQSVNINIVGDGSITLGEYFHPFEWDWMEYFDYEERNTYYSYRTLNLSVRYGTNTNNQEIVANPGSGYEFDHWELQDGISPNVTTYNTAVIPAGTLTFNPGSTLTAVFRKSQQGGGGHIDFSDMIQEWVDKMTKDQPVVDKTASVYDYGNRIYQIDIGVSSELYAVDRNLDVDFVTDVSGSMLFPSKLEAEATFSNATDIFTQLDNLVKQHHYGQLPYSTPIGELYYLILEPHGASNVFVVRRYNGQWWALPDSLPEQIDDPAMGGVWRQLNVADRNGEVVYTNLTYPDPVNGGYYNPDIEKKIYMATDATYRLEYLQQALYLVRDVLYKINPDAKIGVTMFADRVYGSRFYSNAERQQLTSDISNIATHGGTRQDLGLEAGKILLDSETDPSRKKVAILITDGAPNGCTWEQIHEKSDALKEDNIDVYTIGLSVENVEGASDGLWDTSKGYGFAFDARDGRGLVEAVESIIQSLIVQANMTGSVTDTIDPAFYPVAKDGTPLQPGIEYVDDEGHKYTVSQNGGSWIVNWVDQSFGWSYTDMQGKQPGWKGIVYVKARENFLGGNAIKTNHGPDSDKVIATGFKTITYNEDDEEVVLNSDLLKDEDGNPKTRIKTLDSPYVNVDELSFTGNNTQWNVYLGTEVDPKDQLEKLLKNIDIRKVVSGDTNEMITSKEQMLNGTSNASKTIKMTDYLGLDTSAEITDLVNALLSSGSRTYQYNNSFDSAYGHGYVGDIVITLENTSGCYNKGNHTTETIGQDAEFTLKVEYKPRDSMARNSELNLTNDDYHTTPNGSPGEPTGDMTSSNTHTINIFQKGIKLIKTDMDSGRLITSDTAEFTLSSPGKADKTLTTSTTDGSVTENPLEKPNAKTGAGTTGYENYTLTETKAPAGYNSLPESLVINLNLTDSYTDPVTGAVIDPAGGGLYNWTETARITMSGTTSSGLVEADEGNSNSLNSITSIEIFKIPNNPGVELPATGGPGTRIFTILGSILILGAGVLLWKRQFRVPA